MHISEGILSGGALITGWAGTCAGMTLGLRKTGNEKIVRTALLSSAFFLASLVNVRIGPGSTHLSLLAPVGLILGWSAFPAIMIALLLQALLFHFGGLLVLGVNTFNMALPALVVYLVFSKAIREVQSRIIASSLAFLAGGLAVMMGAGLAGMFLGITSRDFLGTAKILLYANVPLALIEGLVTSFMIMWLKKSAPEFLS